MLGACSGRMDGELYDIAFLATVLRLFGGRHVRHGSVLVLLVRIAFHVALTPVSDTLFYCSISYFVRVSRNPMLTPSSFGHLHCFGF